jgi:hypothetical protein
VGDGLTGLDGPFGGASLAVLARTTAAPLHAAIVGPLRATLLTDEARVDDLVRALHARLLETRGLETR